jgi:hypothetical protein
MTDDPTPTVQLVHRAYPLDTPPSRTVQATVTGAPDLPYRFPAIGYATDAAATTPFQMRPNRVFLRYTRRAMTSGPWRTGVIVYGPVINPETDAPYAGTATGTVKFHHPGDDTEPEGWPAWLVELAAEHHPDRDVAAVLDAADVRAIGGDVLDRLRGDALGRHALGLLAKHGPHLPASTTADDEEDPRA